MTNPQKKEEQEELEVQTEPSQAEEEILPLQDIYALIESKVADQVGQLETEREETVTLDDIEAAIANHEQPFQELQGIDEAEVQAKIKVIETKLTERASGEFNKVQVAIGEAKQAVGALEQAGRAKAAEVEAHVESQLTEALKTGLGKIAETETKITQGTSVELKKALDAGRQYVDLRMSEISDLIDTKIQEAFKSRGLK